MRKPPATLYRFFDREEYAEDFCQGRIMISTLDRCRRTEDASRRDSGEGNSAYIFDDFTADSRDPASVEAAARGGFMLHGNGRVNMVGCMSIRATQDAYLLCLSDDCSDYLRSKMGRFVVRISSPLNFFYDLTDALADVVAIQGGQPGAVEYRERASVAPLPPPADPLFTKPVEFTEEREHRFVWLPEASGTGLAPVFVTHAPLGSYVARC